MVNSENFDNSRNPVLLARDSALKQYRDGIMVASSLLQRDFFKVLLLWPLLFAVSVSAHFISPLSFKMLTALTLIERAGSTLFFFIIARKWAKDFSVHKSAPGALAFLRLLAVNLSIWFLISLPSLFDALYTSTVLQVTYLFILLPTLGFLLQFYFYFIPILYGVKSWREIFRESLMFISYHRALPIKLILGPLIFSIFFVALFHAISPDGRYLWVTILMDIAESLFWIVNTYLCLGVGFSILSYRVHTPTGIDPYLRSRLDTLRAFASEILTPIISPANSLKYAIVASLILYANFVRLWETPPRVKMNISSVAVDKDQLKVTIEADDPEYRFRGFNPSLLHIAGETGEELSNKNPKIRIDGQSIEDKVSIWKDQPKMHLAITFTLINRSEEIKNLKDVHLWYGRVKLNHLSPLFQ